MIGKAKQLAKVWKTIGGKHIGSINKGSVVNIIGTLDGYYKVSYPYDGYTKSQWFDIVDSKPLPPLHKPPSPPAVLPENVFRVRRWGDTILVAEASRTVDGLTNSQSNFQAIGLYNTETGFGGVSNALWIPRVDIDRLAEFQKEDNYVAKIADWRDQKMRWLCKPLGTIYFHGDQEGGWKDVPKTKWGTILLGWNFVTVLDTATMTVKPPDGIKRKMEMARLLTFTPSDWDKPLDELVNSGIMQIAYCVYKKNHIGYSPKGICYSPLWSPSYWKFAGQSKPKDFYIPMNWLIKDNTDGLPTEDK